MGVALVGEIDVAIASDGQVAEAREAEATAPAHSVAMVPVGGSKRNTPCAVGYIDESVRADLQAVRGAVILASQVRRGRSG